MSKRQKPYVLGKRQFYFGPVARREYPATRAFLAKQPRLERKDA